MRKCSFCGKGENEVQKLIAGNFMYDEDGKKSQIFICDECIDLCSNIISDIPTQPLPEINMDFSEVKPQKIKAFLDDYVIGQETAKKTLSVAVYNHYKRLNPDIKKCINEEIEIAKSNILLIGSTGCGKTLLAKTLAKHLNVPFAMADATTLTQAGYVGEDVESVLSKLLQSANGDVKRAQNGIVYIDEIDKISRKGNASSSQRDISGEGVQQALLKMMEGTVANVLPAGGRRSPTEKYIQLDTTNILFICGGAFSGLDKLIESRTEKTGIGFSANVKSEEKKTGELLSRLEVDDLLKYGLIPEFLGRLPVVATLDELSEKDMVRILTKPKDALVKQYKALFKMDGVKLTFTEEAYLAIVNLAIKRKTGARGLRSIMEKLLLDTMYNITQMDGLKEVIISKDTVEKNIEPDYIFKEKEQNHG